MQRQQEGLEVKIQSYHAKNIPHSPKLGRTIIGYNSSYHASIIKIKWIGIDST